MADPDPLPPPLVIVPDGAASKAFFPNGEPSPTSPLGTAYLWWAALLDLDNYRDAIEALSSDPADWNGYHEAAQWLHGWALTQGIIEAEDAPGRLAYAKFIRDSGWSMRAFGEVPLDEVYILTMTLDDDSLWRVWGLSKDYVPLPLVSSTSSGVPATRCAARRRLELRRSGP